MLERFIGVFLFREASHIDIVLEKRHMDISLETPQPLRNATHLSICYCKFKHS